MPTAGKCTVTTQYAAVNLHSAHSASATPGLLLCAGPHLGAQFAQLVKELRSEYAAAVTACAERIAGALFQRPGYSINATLHRHGISGTPSIMQQQVPTWHSECVSCP